MHLPYILQYIYFLSVSYPPLSMNQTNYNNVFFKKTQSTVLYTDKIKLYWSLYSIQCNIVVIIGCLVIRWPPKSENSKFFMLLYERENACHVAAISVTKEKITAANDIMARVRRTTVNVLHANNTLQTRLSVFAATFWSIFDDFCTVLMLFSTQYQLLQAQTLVDNQSQTNQGHVHDDNSSHQFPSARHAALTSNSSLHLSCKMFWVPLALVDDGWCGPMWNMEGQSHASIMLSPGFTQHLHKNWKMSL